MFACAIHDAPACFILAGCLCLVAERKDGPNSPCAGPEAPSLAPVGWGIGIDPKPLIRVLFRALQALEARCEQLFSCHSFPGQSNSSNNCDSIKMIAIKLIFVVVIIIVRVVVSIILAIVE